MTDNAEPRAWVVYESMFGNTEDVAHAIADGLQEVGYDVTCAGVASAPHDAPLEGDLLVLGAPTHAFSLSRPNTRGDAVRQGATTERPDIGLREWLTDLDPGQHPEVPVAVFDTRASKVRRLPMAASRAAARILRRKGLRLTTKPQAFLVEDVAGPLVAGELAGAKAWGRALGTTVGARV